MASTRKKQTERKGTGNPGRPRKTQVVEPERGSGFLSAEVSIIGSFALAVFLFLSNFHLCGVVGDFFRGIQLGVFGFMGYLFPLIVFIGTTFYMSNLGNMAAVRKLAAAIAASLVLCAFVQLIMGAELADGEGVMTFYQNSSVNGAGGGLIGGAISMGLRSLAGTVGAFLVLLVIFIICAVCITEKSFVNAVKRRSDTVYQYARDDLDRRKEIHAQRQAIREEELRQRREERLRGVNLAATDLSLSEPVRQSQPAIPQPVISQPVIPQPVVSEHVVSQTAVPEIPVSRGPLQNEDQPPFEQDTAYSAAESAQKLVDEGMGQLSGQDERSMWEEEAEPEDLYSIPLIRAEQVPWDDEPELETSPGYENLSEPAYADEEDEIYMEERGSAEQAAPVTAPVYEEPMPTPVYEQSIPVNTMTDEAYAGTEMYRQAEPEELDVIASSVDRGMFTTREEKTSIQTANGKIIEKDTEALQKKLESRRREELAAQRAAEEDAEEAVAEEIKAKEEAPKKEYIFPPLSLLKKGDRVVSNHSDQEYRETAMKLQQTLKTFGVGVTVTNISCGPSVTRYELHPEMGVKVSKIVGLADDIKLSLAAADIRIEAPIPGKSAVGIEVPNKENVTVYLRDLFEADNFRNHGSRLAFAVGKDIAGQVVVTDIAKMPHLLIAGATGSGKSVCINTLIMSIIYKADPEDVKLILVDPKVVELSVYNGIPHLMIPVVTDPKKAAGALNWAVAEMTDRYKKFAKYGVRDLKGFNAKVENIKDIDDANKPQKMPQIVIIIDELADLMMVASNEVEDAICRLAQLARACGIHLVIATQRPSVNVITGLIKANVPSRIAFSVSSGVDSRTILDMNGAEKLLGKGDMLFYPAGYPKPQRVQGAFVSDSEVQAVVEFLTEQGMSADYNLDVEQQLTAAPAGQSSGKSDNDEYFAEAGRFIIEKDKASIGMLQRMFKIGFNRAARIMDQLAEANVVGPEEGTKPRKILMTMAEFEELLSRGA